MRQYIISDEGVVSDCFIESALNTIWLTEYDPVVNNCVKCLDYVNKARH